MFHRFERISTMPKLPKFMASHDRTPKYTVKKAAEMMDLSAYTVRYYDNSGLLPGVERTDGNIRMFSDYSMGWLRLVHCLRATGLPIEGVRRYIELCGGGDATIPERAEIIFAQERSLKQQIKILNRQMEVLRYKKKFYLDLLSGKTGDRCNPAAGIKAEPDIMPAKQ